MSAGDPVDVSTGRVFTLPTLDVWFRGPLPLEIYRVYSSHRAGHDIGLGFGWMHSLAWELVLRSRTIEIWDDNGTMLEIDRPTQIGEEVTGKKGRLIVREAQGFAVEIGGLWRHFDVPADDGRRLRLGSVRDRNGNTIRLRYDAAGRLIEVVDSVGRVVRVIHTPDGRIGAFESKNAPEQGRWIRFAEYRYNEAGDLVSVLDCRGHVARYEYYEEHYLRSATEPDSLTFHFLYDRHWRCTQTWGCLPDGSVPGMSPNVPAVLADGQTRAKGFLHCKIDYASKDYREVVDSLAVRRAFFNSMGLATKAVSSGNVTTRQFDENGFVVLQQDALGASWSAVRDHRGHAVEITNPLGNKTTITRDPQGLLLEARDAMGLILRARYDSHGNPVEITKARGEITQREYDTRGNMTRQVLANGAAIYYEYDAYCNLVTVKEPEGRVWRYRYDYFGRCIAQVDPRGAETRFTYDDGGRQTGVYFPNGGVERRTYNGVDKLVQLEEPDGQVWKAEWLHGKIWRIVQPNGCTLLYLVNREGTLIEQQNEKGEVRTLTPNVDGIYTRIESFDGRVQRFKYDAMNRLVEYENGRAEKRKYERNAAGQVMEVTFADDTASTFEYDLRGHLVRATNPSGSYVYDRDAAGALIKETHIAPDGAIHVETTFDAIRDKVRIATSLGHEHAVERGAQGTAIRSTLDGVESLSFLYDPVGREVARAFSRGALQETEYGLEGPYTRRRVLSPFATSAPRHGPAEPEWVGAQPGNAVVAKAFRFSRNAQQAVSRWDSSFGGLQYEYDQREQLVATVDANGAAERFRYDEARNISHDGGHPRRYRKGNVLEEKGNARYLWDADGCLVEKRELAADGTERTWRYEWSGAGDLARVVTPEGTEVEFAYDPFSRRVRKEVFERSGGERALRSSTRYVWSDTKILHEIRRTAQANGDPVVHERTYAYDPNDLFPLGHREDVSSPAGRKAGPWTYYVNDPLGTPEHLVTGDGKVVGEMSRSAWGVTTATGETTPHRFQGQWADSETGLHYNRYRYYDPDTGRYVSPDPAGNLPDPNVYLYCWNPIGWVDPEGLAHTATGTFTPAGGGPPINLGTTSSYNSEPDNYSRNYNAANGINPFQNLTARGPNGELLHRTSDTEQQMIRDLEARQAAGQVNLQGGHLEINGTLPPCPACHREMQAFAARNNCTVTYNHTGDPNSRIAANRTPGTSHYP